MNGRWLNITTGILLIVLLAIGFTLARHRPLWNDEIYTQMGGIEELSYAQIVLGKIGEGNNAPLFYLIQKGICDVFRYQPPEEWRLGTAYWGINRPVDQIVLRINPVVFTSLAIAGIFYFFTKFYSVGSGLFSLFLSLSTSILWGYWAEARPYALWVFLTTIQMLLFLSILKHKEKESAAWTWLIIIHVLLSLTMVLSLPQILIVAVLLWFLSGKKGKRYLLLAGIPVLLGLIYYSLSPKFNFWVEFSVEQYIRAGISRDRLYIMFIFIFYLILYGLQQRLKFFNLFEDKVICEGIPLLWLMTAMIFVVSLIVLALKGMTTGNQQGFPFTDRYFIHLAPVGIIASTFFTTSLVRAFRQKTWMQIMLLSGIGYLTIHRLFKIIPEIKGYYPQLFS